MTFWFVGLGFVTWFRKLDCAFFIGGQMPEWCTFKSTKP